MKRTIKELTRVSSTVGSTEEGYFDDYYIETTKEIEVEENQS